MSQTPQPETTPRPSPPRLLRALAVLEDGRVLPIVGRDREELWRAAEALGEHAEPVPVAISSGAA